VISAQTPPRPRPDTGPPGPVPTAGRRRSPVPPRFLTGLPAPPP
jgi:hypothetical protein